MTGDGQRIDDREERLHAILLGYVEDAEAGRAPARQQLLAAHPDFEADLHEFFRSHDAVERLAAPLRAAGGAEPRDDEACDEAMPVELGQLGDFRLLREVGRGGMGVVYEAEQISLRRRVALKVLPFATALDARQLQRFKNEALAAAHLRHENIVPVHAVGQERGVHYYAMPFIDGQSLAALIGQLREIRSPKALPAGDPTQKSARTGLDLGVPVSGCGSRMADFCRWAAQVGRQAALALEHAHQMGVLHRDIKPANLLIDPRGQLWVADFGLAQIGGHGGITRTGEMLGTLRYASPEQAGARRGPVDHRTDVYSLGATLYELLALRPIFAGTTANELLRQISDDEPPPLRRVQAGVPPELETIVLKALSKEPADRYATAQDMADDLARFLDNRPIQARRPTVTERLRKWTRRHPSVAIAAVMVLLLWSAGSFVSTLLVRHEQQRAEEAFQRERQRAEEAEVRFQLAQRAVNEMIQVSEKELASRPGMEGVRSRLLKSALGYYQELIAERDDDPAAQAALRDTRDGVEKVLADLAALRGMGQRILLNHPAVLAELKVDAGQRRRIQEWSARVQKNQIERWRDFGQLSPGERGRELLRQARANDAEVHGILTAAQLRRLQQIALQVQGPGVFREPEVVAALQLSDEQRERIAAIEEEAQFAWMKSPRPGKAERPASERIVAVLHKEQVRQWREMTGEAVKVAITPLPPPAPAGAPGAKSINR